ncbi:MAG: DNA-directed RNA polymerase subunit omega [Sebaldella sp.]|nr:DNA-directed RNA polymerase subunit omega [Sebaldella sp.]
MKRKQITVDELLYKIPNKYELAIVAGKAARDLFLQGEEKSKIMDKVFEDILSDKIKI